VRDRVYTALLFNYQVLLFMEVQWGSSQMPSYAHNNATFRF